jgi:hypothetical protein
MFYQINILDVGDKNRLQVSRKIAALLKGKMAKNLPVIKLEQQPNAEFNLDEVNQKISQAGGKIWSIFSPTGERQVFPETTYWSWSIEISKLHREALTPPQIAFPRGAVLGGFLSLLSLSISLSSLDAKTLGELLLKFVPGLIGYIVSFIIYGKLNPTLFKTPIATGTKLGCLMGLVSLAFVVPWGRIDLVRALVQEQANKGLLLPSLSMPLSIISLFLAIVSLFLVWRTVITTVMVGD